MKAVPLALSSALALLLSWGIYKLTHSSAIALPLSVTCFVSMAICLGIALCGRVKDYPRSTHVLRSISLFTTCILLAVNICFALFAGSMTPVILTDGIILIVYLFTAYSIAGSRQ